MAVVYLIMILVGAAAAVFAIQNIDPVVIRFLSWRVEGMPLALVILLSTFAGLVFASMIAMVQQLRLRSRIRALERQLAAPPPPVEPPPPAPPSMPKIHP
ncbi:MAG TPA: LapA family protein [Methylomirabilota bacterium]|nr:LapA family protein [Methylomirabilota bacterium]